MPSIWGKRAHGAANIADSIGAGRAPAQADPSAEWLGVKKLGGVYAIPTGRVAPDPQQVRAADFAAPEMAARIEALAALIREEGQLVPGKVRWRADLDRYQIVDGECRYRACVLLGRDFEATIDAGEEPSEADTLIQQYVANEARAGIDPIAKARAYERLIAAGLSAGAVAVRLGVSAALVSRHRALLALPEPVRALVASGALAWTKAETLLPLGPREASDLGRRAAANHWSRGRLGAEVDAVLGVVRPEATRPDPGPLPVGEGLPFTGETAAGPAPPPRTAAPPVSPGKAGEGVPADPVAPIPAGDSPPAPPRADGPSEAARPADPPPGPEADGIELVWKAGDPEWGRPGTFTVYLEDRSPVEVAYDGKGAPGDPGPTGHFEFRGALSETGYYSHFFDRGRVREAETTRTYAGRIARETHAATARAAGQVARDVTREAKARARAGGSTPADPRPRTSGEVPGAWCVKEEGGADHPQDAFYTLRDQRGRPRWDPFGVAVLIRAGSGVAARIAALEEALARAREDLGVAQGGGIDAAPAPAPAPASVKPDGRVVDDLPGQGHLFP